LIDLTIREVIEMSDEEFNPFKKGVSSHRNVDRGPRFESGRSYQPNYGEPQRPRTYSSDYREEDPYERDENGRPVGFKKGSGGVVRRRPASDGQSMKPFVILSGIFAASMLVTGQVLYAAVIAGMTFLVYFLSRYRR
jgi:hypothetical protein